MMFIAACANWFLNVDPYSVEVSKIAMQLGTEIIKLLFENSNWSEVETRMWVDAQRDGRPAAKFGWSPLSDVAEASKTTRETREICWSAPNSPTYIRR